ncbi:glycosyltransferase [bacterium]|nr:glycosyltransferase [bacterium]
MGFLNISILKQVGLGFSFFFNTLSWIWKNRGKEKYIIMDASYITAIPFVLFASKFGKCKTSAIFCDIYEYMAEVKDARNNENVSLTRRIARKLTSHNYRKLDSFILLTEQMNSVVNTKNRPYIVIEGLVDINMKAENNDIKYKEQNDVILYAGILKEKYGLKNLIEGFKNYKGNNARLWIFGTGEYASEVQKNVLLDKRIEYFGLVNLDEVVKHEIKATLLVNPRPTDEDFTKYSFPSKNLEYMVSGTPILTTKLPGMPLEYYDYIYTIDGNTKKDITIALENFLSKSDEELHEKGNKAKKFVLENKNNIIQTKKIIKLISK